MPDLDTTKAIDAALSDGRLLNASLTPDLMLDLIRGVKTIRLGSMLADVIILTDPALCGVLVNCYGDERILERLCHSVNDKHELLLEVGNVAQKPRTQPKSRIQRSVQAFLAFCNRVGNDHVGGDTSSMDEADNETDPYRSSKSIHFRDPGEPDVRMVNGHEIDMSRQVHVIIQTPPNVNVTIDAVTGTVAIDRLNGVLGIHSSSADVFAHQVNSLYVAVESPEIIKIGNVTDAAYIYAGEHSSHISLGQVYGGITVNASGCTIVVEGGITGGEAHIRINDGHFTHHGIVAGDLTPRASHAKIRVHTLSGKLNTPYINGAFSELVVNGETHPHKS